MSGKRSVGLGYQDQALLRGVPRCRHEKRAVSLNPQVPSQMSMLSVKSEKKMLRELLLARQDDM